jgi:hypothetical protein
LPSTQAHDHHQETPTVNPPPVACRTAADCGPLQVLHGELTALDAREAEHHSDTAKRLDAHDKALQGIPRLEIKLLWWGLGIIVPAWLSMLMLLFGFLLRR